jgi:hypothetical protein
MKVTDGRQARSAIRLLAVTGTDEDATQSAVLRRQPLIES